MYHRILIYGLHLGFGIVPRRFVKVVCCSVTFDRETCIWYLAEVLSHPT